MRSECCDRRFQCQNCATALRRGAEASDHEVACRASNALRCMTTTFALRGLTMAPIECGDQAANLLSESSFVTVVMI
jgi:hypothetical protein